MRQFNPSYNRLMWGVVFIIAGALILANNFDMLPWEFKEYLFTWQGILIAIGCVTLLTSRDAFPGIILIAIGGYFLIEEYHFLPYSLDKFFWPMILALIGLSIIFKRDKKGHFHSRWHYESEIKDENNK